MKLIINYFNHLFTDSHQLLKENFGKRLKVHRLCRCQPEVRAAATTKWCWHQGEDREFSRVQNERFHSQTCKYRLCCRERSQIQSSCLSSLQNKSLMWGIGSDERGRPVAGVILKTYLMKVRTTPRS